MRNLSGKETILERISERGGIYMRTTENKYAMQIRLQMLMKAPVVFTQRDPSVVLGDECLADILGCCRTREEAAARLWAAYGRTVLSEVDPCMEANDGISATLECLSHYPTLSEMSVRWVAPGCYSLWLHGAGLHLYENPRRELSVSFSFPGKDTEAIDVTDYSSDAAAYFIATLFGAWSGIERFLDSLC